MRRVSLRLLVALTTVTISVSSTWLLHRLLQPTLTRVEPAPCLTPTSPPAPKTVRVQSEEEEAAEYPDSAPLSPWDISSFIEAHPRAKLKRLWDRLRPKPGEWRYEFSECGYCTVSLDYYDLDMELGDEALLKISAPFAESYRYLVFKRLDASENGWRFIGNFDEWGKYRESQGVILLSGGRTWLVISGQSGSGSGVAYFHNHVFAVTTHGLKEVASYECEGHQSGEGDWPTKEFSTRILDVHHEGSQILVKIEFNADYQTSGGENLPLFSKRQVALFVSSSKQGSVLNQKESTMTQRELEHIYQIDAMTAHDFLKYNLSELMNLARRGNTTQKPWLKNFLERCGSSTEKRQLVAALAN